VLRHYEVVSERYPLQHGSRTAGRPPSLSVLAQLVHQVPIEISKELRSRIPHNFHDASHVGILSFGIAETRRVEEGSGRLFNPARLLCSQPTQALSGSPRRTIRRSPLQRWAAWAHYFVSSYVTFTVNTIV
jgi:hypothetical protein